MCDPDKAQLDAMRKVVLKLAKLWITWSNNLKDMKMLVHTKRSIQSC